MQKGLQGFGKRIFWLLTGGAERRVWPEAAAGTAQGHGRLPVKEGHDIMPHCVPPFASTLAPLKCSHRPSSLRKG